MQLTHLFSSIASTKAVTAIFLTAGLVAAIDTVLPLGPKSWSGGTVKAGELDPNAAPNNNGSAGKTVTASIKNTIDPPVDITDLTVSVKNGTATVLKIDQTGNTNNKDELNMTTPLSGGSSGTKNPLTNSIAGNATRGYQIEGVKADGSGKNIEFWVTPSVAATISGSSVSMNSTPTYKLDEMTYLIASGVAEAVHGDLLIPIVNYDEGKGLSAIAGSAAIPSLPNATINSVHIFDANWNPKAGSSVAVNGLDYTISGFTPFPPSEGGFIVVRFSEAPGGAGSVIRNTITAEFSAIE